MIGKTAATAGSQAAIEIAGLVTGILVAQLLGPQGRGEIAAVIAWASLVAYVGDLGLPAAFAYRAARDSGSHRTLAGNAVLAALLQWPALALAGAVVLPLALERHGTALVELALLYLLAYLPLNFLTRSLNGIQQGAGRYAAFNAVRVSVSLSYVAALLAAYALQHVSLGTVLAANLASNAVALALATALLLRLLRPAGVAGGPRKPWIRLRDLARDLRYGLANHIGGLQPFSSLRIDVLALTLIVGTHDVGLYMAALAGAAVIRAQGYALGLIVLPEVARRADVAEQRSVVVRFAWLSLAAGGASGAIAIVWAEPLLALVFGEPFREAAPILRIMVLAGIAASLYRVLADGLRGMGQPLKPTLAEIGGLAIGLPALSALVPAFGTLGAAMAVAAVSFGTLAVVAWGFLHACTRTGALQATRP